MSETHDLLMKVWHRELSADEAYEELIDKYDAAADRVLAITARVAELEQQLKTANKQLVIAQADVNEMAESVLYYKQQAFDAQRKAMREYAGAVEVEGFSVGGGSISLDNHIPWGYGQRVRVLVMKEDK